MSWRVAPQDDQWYAVESELDADEEEAHESHEPPRGALLITCGYLVLICVLWLEVYLQLINNGGVPRL